MLESIILFWLFSLFFKSPKKSTSQYTAELIVSLSLLFGIPLICAFVGVGIFLLFEVKALYGYFGVGAVAVCLYFMFRNKKTPEGNIPEVNEKNLEKWDQNHKAGDILYSSYDLRHSAFIELPFKNLIRLYQENNCSIEELKAAALPIIIYRFNSLLNKQLESLLELKAITFKEAQVIARWECKHSPYMAKYSLSKFLTEEEIEYFAKQQLNHERNRVGLPTL